MIKYLQIEKAVLGTMLAEPYLVGDGGVGTDYFTHHIHKHIFDSMQSLLAKNVPVDDVTLLTMREPAELGGANYVMELKNYARPTHFNKHVEVMREGWKAREKMKILVQATEGDWAIHKIQQALHTVEIEGNTGGETSIQLDLIQMGERPYEAMTTKQGVPTGLAPMDDLLNGFQPAELIVIAARPSMGKTDLLNHFALQAGKSGYKPIVFSLEMSRKSMIDRLIAAVGGYSRLRMRDPYAYFTEKQKASWLTVLGIVDQANIHIDDRAGITVNEMRAVTRRIMHGEPKFKPIIFVDYLQIIHSNKQARNRTEIVGDISNALKQMAKEFDCPVVCLFVATQSWG